MTISPSVWDSSVPPGGYVCAGCGTPTETEPCPEHQATRSSQAQADRCPECDGIGSHGLVHVRYGNGGGGNRPCSQSTAQGREAGR